MATPMQRDQFEALTNLQLTLSTVFKDNILLNDQLVSLYNIQNSSKAEERNQMRGGFGSIPKFNGSLEYDAIELTYRADYRHEEYAEGFAVERKLIDDEEYTVMGSLAQDLGIAFDYTVLEHMASVFNNSFSSSYLGPDSKALCADDHPYSPTNSDTQDNKRTDALTHAAVVADRRDMLKFVNSRGKKAPAILDTIVVPPDLIEEARVIAESEMKSGTANNDANTFRGLNVVSSPLLTDANNWWSVDSRRARQYLRWYWRVMPEFAADPTSDFNLVVRFRGYARWSYGWDDWRWLIGHEVA